MQQNPFEWIALPDFTRLPEAGPGEALPALPTKLACVTVNYGDTLSGIAALFGTTVADIVRMNGIANPDRIFPGTRLYLRVPVSAPLVPCDRYIVRPGDSLSRIAARLGLDLRALIEANDLPDPDRIFPGQLLRLPA